MFLTEDIVPDFNSIKIFYHFKPENATYRGRKSEFSEKTKHRRQQPAAILRQYRIKRFRFAAFWGLFVMHDEAHRRFGVIFRNRKPALLEEIKKIRECGAEVIHAVRLAK